MLDRFHKPLATTMLAALLAWSPITASAQNIPPEGFRFVGECELQIFFAAGVTTLTPEQSSAVSRFVAEAQTDAFAVRGHASTTGNPQSNAALAQARAQTGVAALSRDGVTGVRVFAGQTGDGPQFQRNDLLRDSCTGSVAQFREVTVASSETNAGAGIGLGAGIGVGLGLLLLLGVAGAGGSSDGTN